MRHGRIDTVGLDLGANRAEVELPAPGELECWPLSIAAAFTTSATVANRTVGLEYRDQADRLVFRAASDQAIAAGATFEVCAAVEAVPADHAGIDTITLRLPELPLLPGWTLRLVAFNEQAGDAYGAGIAVVEYGPATLRELAAEELEERTVYIGGLRAGHHYAG